MRGKIVAGKIKSIGSDKDLPYELPVQIDFSNFREYVCVNLEESEKIESWKEISQLEQEVIEQESFEKADPIIEEVDMEEVNNGRKARLALRVFAYVMYTACIIFWLPEVVEIAEVFGWVKVIGFVLCFIAFNTAAKMATKDYRSWKNID